jgi:Peptidase M15
MSGIRRSAAIAAAMTLGSLGSSLAQDASSPLAFFAPEQNTSKPQIAPAGPSAASGGVKVSSGGVVQSGPAGTVQKQIPSVATGCLKPDLMRIVRGASAHFGSAAIITSGYRSGRRSYHGKCMAADVQIAGVSPGTLARYFRSQSGVGGVGTYGHTRSVHVDVAPRQYTWYHGRRKRYASLDTGGCPCCTGLSYVGARSVAPIARPARTCVEAPGAFASLKLGAKRA